MYSFESATEAELNELLSGHMVLQGSPWPRPSAHKIADGEFGVLWREPEDGSDAVRPAMLVVRSEDQRRLFARVAQLRSDLAPLTSWCHVVTPRMFERIDEGTRRVEAGAMSAAWSGLVVAEAALLSDRPLNKIMAPACFATMTFSVARSTLLWGSGRSRDILDNFDAAHSMLRQQDRRSRQLREIFEPIWSVLSGDGSSKGSSFESDSALRHALLYLAEMRSVKSQNEAHELYEVIGPFISELSTFRRLSEMGPEQRLKMFDAVVSLLGRRGGLTLEPKQSVLCFVAGYIATVVSGGFANLPLLQGVQREWPEIAAWAYIAGGIGEQIVWTSAFDGLGRLVSRELLRPFRVGDAPTCDFSIDEAMIAFDRQLKDPLVHLRIKQSRVVTVSLGLGANTLVPLADAASSDRDDMQSVRNERSIDREQPRMPAFEALADALWPYLGSRVERMVLAEHKKAAASEAARGRARKKPSQSSLPLKDRSE